ncbi:hypothetical protein FYK55_13205 [Roseiconus nitratireducens]|uniref:Uncharacterized protein n=1 Tax=Roseiconus nitratireducens TaxID=2605748 RepID=A0A5M6D6S8_9BACT|nr:hypothetical protein [Roseiconus nitratireducens]KAA5543228.1 hypothetical protein FYK55_13205 [Roseiconus nitratireducens]
MTTANGKSDSEAPPSNVADVESGLNPYQPPAPVAEEPSKGGTQSGQDLMRFRSDWSREGLHQRRVSMRSNTLFFVLAVAAAIAAAFVSVTSLALAMIAVPVGIGLLSGWALSSLSGPSSRFWLYYPGFAGPVAGWLSNDFIAVDGPHAAVAAKLSSHGCRRAGATTMVTMPFATLPVPVMDSDIIDGDEAPAINREPIAAIRELMSLQNTMEIRGELSERDFAGTPRARWRKLGVACCLVLAAVLLAVAIGIGMSLSSRAMAFPRGYAIRDQQVGRENGALVALAIGVVVFIAGGWQWILGRSSIGEFYWSLSPKCVAVAAAPYRVCYAYHDAALEHFRWSITGLLLVGGDGKERLLLPARWLTARQAAQLAAWFPEPDTNPDRNYFVGPSI